MNKVSTEKFCKKVEQRLNVADNDVLDGSWRMEQEESSGGAEGKRGPRLV